ncbi:uncharacterized protein LOC141632058 [Silene latifolia]|uniref:uncharacterized protein LOC141632058 n=1 Tax=Silene latifolia TaxID=37657 RepID=UPI003D78001E
MDGKHTKYLILKGDNYSWWKHRMEHYVKSTDYECWVIIQKGPLTITVTDSDRNNAVKSEESYVEADYRKVEKNSKAMSILQYGIGEKDINRISGCTSAKEIWDTLSLADEETSQVKKHRIDLLMQQYEMFTMMKDESINCISSRFSSIVNELKSLGREVESEDIVRKILRSLSDKCQPKVTAIEEAKDLSELSLNELMGSLMANELNLAKCSGECSEARGFSLKLTSSNEEDDGDDEQAMYSRNMAYMINSPNLKKFNNYSKKRFQKKRSYSTVACFKCGEKENESFIIQVDILTKERDSLLADLTSCRNDNKQLEQIALLLSDECSHVKSAFDNIGQINLDHLAKVETLTKELHDAKEFYRKWEEKVGLGFKSNSSVNCNFRNQEPSKTDFLRRKYAGLPEYIVCNFCGKTGHEFNGCPERLNDLNKNIKALVRGSNNWYLDSGCSRHMTGSKNQFLSLEAYNGGTVTFGDNKKGEIIALGKVGKSSSQCVDKVMLIKGLNHNLLSISQLCDNGNIV